MSPEVGRFGPGGHGFDRRGRSWQTGPIQVRRRLDDPLLNNLAMLLTPFTAFLAAQAIHASGVLAVVVCGLIMSQAGPRLASVGQAVARASSLDRLAISAMSWQGPRSAGP